ncbi:MAG: LAGLIDADG family homing endonuclease, partial [Patescibacteria group bacterium]
MADSEKGAPRDPIRETALRDIEKLRDDLTQGIEHFFQYAFYVTLFANSKEALDKTTEEVESMFGSKLIYTKKVFFQSEQGFNSTLPLGNDELMITFNLNSSPIASSFPFISSDLTSDNGILYGINRHNNSLILFDRFSLQNANMVVFATSGAGKSVDYNTEVLIKDKNEVVRQLQIGQLIEELGVRHKFEQIDGEMEGVINPGISVYTFNNQLKGEWSRVSVAARKITPADMYVFRTASGREINVTGDHNMLVLRNGQVVAAKSHEICAGEYVPLPRQVPQPVKPINELDIWSLCGNSPYLYVSGLAEYIKRHKNALKGKMIDEKLDKYLYQYAKGRRIPIFYVKKIIELLGIPLSAEEREAIIIGSTNKKTAWTSLKVSLSINPELMRLLGYIVSEGTIGRSFVLISNEDVEVKNDIAHCLKILGITYFNRASDGSFVIASRSFFELMRAIGVKGKAGDKRVPSFLFNCSNHLVAEFLRAYYEGDGGVEKNSVTACTKSKGLASDLAYLLLRFGIVARLSARQKTATNSGFRGIYQIITISGQEHLNAFRERVNFISRRKQTLLNAVSSNKFGNTNVDIIPVKEVLHELYGLFTAPLRGLQMLIDIKNGAYQPSRRVLKQLIMMIEERI